MKRLIWTLPLLAIVAGALTSLVFYRSSTQLLGGLGHEDSPALGHAQSLIFDLTSVADGLKSAVAAADKAALEGAKARAGKFREDLAAYGKVPGRAEPAAQLSKDFEAYMGSALQVADIMLDGKAGDATASAQAMQGAYAALDKALKEQKEAARAALDAHIADAQAVAQRGFAASVVASLLTLGLSALVAWWSVRTLMGQLGGKPEEATRIVRRIAGGDLSQPVQLQHAGADSLLHAMGGMQDRLADVIGDVRAAVTHVNRAAGEISHGNQSLAERSERQAESLRASAASVDELTASVRRNAESAEQAQSLAERARVDAEAGSHAMSDAVATMGEVSERARKIVEITALIDGIAFQTNILALNAAVEAARAGEQGRGFSVVAGEVRTLAQRAGVAAKDIRALIDDSAERIETGARHVNTAGAAMADLVDSVRKVGEFIALISGASAEQRTGIEQVNHAVSELDATTQQNHALVAQAGHASQALLSVARQLDEVVGRFRLAASDAAAAATPPNPVPASSIHHEAQHA